MKTLFLFIAIFTLLSCEKENIKPVKERFLIKYEVDCSNNGFDITYTVAASKAERKFISGSHWDTTFMNVSVDTLFIGATAKEVHSKISGKIYYNGELLDSMVVDNRDGTMLNCYIVFGHILD